MKLKEVLEKLRKCLKLNMFSRIVIGAVILFLAITAVKIQLEINELQEKKIALNEQIDDYVFSIDKIQNDLNTPVDEDYIIRIAKEKLNLRLPEEIIFYNNLAN